MHRRIAVNLRTKIGIGKDGAMEKQKAFTGLPAKAFLIFSVDLPSYELAFSMVLDLLSKQVLITVFRISTGCVTELWIIRFL
jgi:hypothetical protein